MCGLPARGVRAVPEWVGLSRPRRVVPRVLTATFVGEEQDAAEMISSETYSADR